MNVGCWGVMSFYRSFKRLALLVALLAWVGYAHAQTSPNLKYGDVPSAADWNAFFAGKQDYSALNVLGPGSSAAGHCVKWADATGTRLVDAGPCATGNTIDVFNVADFGAVCDGSTNDNTAINATLTAAYNSTAYQNNNAVTITGPSGAHSVRLRHQLPEFHTF